jgi:hypothetical protein
VYTKTQSGISSKSLFALHIAHTPMNNGDLLYVAGYTLQLVLSL